MYTELSSTNASVKSLIDVDVDDSIYVFNLLTADFLFVPSAPSSIIIKSESVIAAPISVAPSISNEDNEPFLLWRFDLILNQQLNLLIHR